MRFAIVPESLIERENEQHILVYCQIYLKLVMCTKINVRAISRQTGLNYGVVYRLKKQAEDMLESATTHRGSKKPKTKPSKIKRKSNDNSITYNPQESDMSEPPSDNSTQNQRQPRKTERNPSAHSPRFAGNLRLVLEEEQETETNLLTIEEMMNLNPNDRQRYILKNEQELRAKGMI